MILSDDKVKAVLFNIFGGITRCDEVARGLIEAFGQIKPDVPFVVRLDGTNDEEGRRLLAEAEPAQRAPWRRRCSTRPRRSSSSRRSGAPHEHPRRQRHQARRRRHHRARGQLPRPQQPPLRHERRRRRHARQGRPGRRGRAGVQHLRTTRSSEAGANTAMVFVPPRFAADSILEAADAGIELVICITEGIPAHDMLRVYTHLRRRRHAARSAPTARASSRRARPTWGSSPPSFFSEGNVGLVSRSGTLTYQIGNELAQQRLRQLVDRRHRRRPDRRLVLHRHRRRCSRPTRRPS